ncbi:MAG: ATP-binding protein [Candidatus Hermodarchaeia archaeon]
MCKVCTMHGGGKKWFEVKRHVEVKYAKELGFEPWEKDHWQYVHQQYAQLASQAGDSMADPALAENIRKLLTDMIFQIHPLTKDVTFTFPQGHGAQVLTRQELEGVIKLSGEPYLVECLCRKMINNASDRCCIPLGLHGETAEMFPSKNEKVERISVDEAIALTRQFNKDGRVHTLAGTPLPMAMAVCNCDLPFCIALRPRVDMGFKYIIRSHWVAKVDVDKCSGCQECLSRCQFGAIQFQNSTERATIDMWKCYGCGLCAETCPEKAIDLLDRESLPALKDWW